MCKFDFELINDMEEYYVMKKPIYFFSNKKKLFIFVCVSLYILKLIIILKQCGIVDRYRNIMF